MYSPPIVVRWNASAAEVTFMNRFSANICFA